MATWLFVSIQKTGTENTRMQNDVRGGGVISHATRFSHAKKRQKRLNALKDSMVRLPVEEAASEDGRKPSRQLRPQPSSKKAPTQEVSDGVGLPPLPRSPLDQNKAEPFCSDHIRELPSIMQEGLEYAYEVLWPANSPAVQGGTLRATIAAWRMAGLESPVEFHTQVSNAASLCLAMSTDPSSIKTLSSLRILHQYKAIRLVQKSLNELNGPPPVTLITSIMNLHGQGAQMVESPPTDPATPESPIFKGFNLQHYGRFTPPRAHFPALVILVGRRGGLTFLPPGLADPLQLTDLAGANFHLTVPKFPLLPSIAELADNEKVDYDAQAEALLADLGTGFRLRGYGRDFQLTQLLLTACRITAAIDELRRNAAGKSPMHILVVQGIAFQHRLLCLVPTPLLDVEPGIVAVEDHLFEICRLSAFVYSDFVIFPTAQARGGRGRLAGLLKDRLIQCFRCHGDRLSESSDLDDLVIWSIVLGGIAAFATPNRPWYVGQLYGRTTARGMTQDFLKMMLRQLLYWDYVFAPPLAILWSEMFPEPKGPAKIEPLSVSPVSRHRPWSALRDTGESSAAAGADG